MDFEILQRSRKTKALVGVIKTSHGSVMTPAFAPVGTHASVKALRPEDLKELGVQIILANTYHLYLSSGEDVVAKLGGLHKFMNFEGVIMTDSGGFQVFSLGAGLEHGVGKITKISRPSGPASAYDLANLTKPGFVKIKEEGVEFRSHIDGSKHILTPEKSIQIQEKLGADLILAFDECTSPLHDYNYTKKAMERTHRWAKRCLEVKTKKGQALFGIAQGGPYEDLRKESAKFINSLLFDGFAIGGSFGKKEMVSVLRWTIPSLEEEKPRHLLGIGELDDIKRAVKEGIDLFDCVLPTRLARNGTLLKKFTKPGFIKIDIRKSTYKSQKSPIDKKCSCYTCQNFSLAYLRHLYKSKEILYHTLASIHNIAFMMNFMKDLRDTISYS